MKQLDKENELQQLVLKEDPPRSYSWFRPRPTRSLHGGRKRTGRILQQDRFPRLGSSGPELGGANPTSASDRPSLVRADLEKPARAQRIGGGPILLDVGQPLAIRRPSQRAGPIRIASRRREDCRAKGEKHPRVPNKPGASLVRSQTSERAPLSVYGLTRPPHMSA